MTPNLTPLTYSNQELNSSLHSSSYRYNGNKYTLRALKRKLYILLTEETKVLVNTIQFARYITILSTNSFFMKIHDYQLVKESDWFHVNSTHFMLIHRPNYLNFTEVDNNYNVFTN